MKDIYFEIHIEMVSLFFYFREDMVFDGYTQISLDDATIQM